MAELDNMIKFDDEEELLDSVWENKRSKREKSLFDK
jgi:hypothetical protein